MILSSRRQTVKVKLNRTKKLENALAQAYADIETFEVAYRSDPGPLLLTIGVNRMTGKVSLCSNMIEHEAIYDRELAMLLEALAQVQALYLKSQAARAVHHSHEASPEASIPPAPEETPEA